MKPDIYFDCGAKPMGFGCIWIVFDINFFFLSEGSVLLVYCIFVLVTHDKLYRTKCKYDLKKSFCSKVL